MVEKKQTEQAERRARRRITVSLSLLVRGYDIYGSAFEDATSSYDISREGASFLTWRELQIGQEVELILLQRPGGRETSGAFETTGEVRRLVPRGPGQWEVGVRFTGPRLRTYMPETA